MKNLNKGDIISQVADATSMSKAQVKKVLDATLDIIVKSAVKGDKISLTGYMTFKTVDRKARKGFNPSTKKPITIPAKKVVKAVLGTKFDR